MVLGGLVDLDVQGYAVGGRHGEGAARRLDQARAGLERVGPPAVHAVGHQARRRGRPGHTDADPEADEATSTRAHASPPTYTRGTRGPIRVTIS